MINNIFINLYTYINEKCVYIYNYVYIYIRKSVLCTNIECDDNDIEYHLIK